jgi:hypothetical protein
MADERFPRPGGPEPDEQPPDDVDEPTDAEVEDDPNTSPIDPEV